MESSLSPAVSNIFTSYFEKLALNTEQQNYHYDSVYSLQEFLNHIHSLRPTIKFTIDVETDSVIPLLDMLVINKGSTMDTEVYRKHTHWPLPSFAIESSITFEKRSCAEPLLQSYYHMAL